MRIGPINTNPRSIKLGSIIFVLLLCFSSCLKLNTKYPPILSTAIDLFYEGNKNDSVILLLNSPELEDHKQNKDINDLKSVFLAGACCENGETDKAWLLINNITPNKNNQKLTYYHNSIKALIEFRRFNPSKAQDALLSLVNARHYDLRTHALNERILGRIMSHHFDNRNSLHWLLESKYNFKASGLKNNEGVSNVIICYLCLEAGYFDDGILYLKEAERIFVKYKDFANLFYIHMLNTYMYIKQGKPDIAEQHLGKAIECQKLSKDIQMKAYILLNQAEIEKLRGNYDQSIKIFHSAIKLEKNYYGSTRIRRISYLNLAKIHNLLNQGEKAREDAYAALRTIISNDRNDLKPDLYYEIAKSYLHTEPLKMNSYMDSAIYFFREHHKLQTVHLLKMYNAQHELTEANERAEQIKKTGRTHAIVSAIVVIILAIGTFIFYRISAIRKEQNNTLLILVKKNLKLLEEEKLSKKLLQEKNCVNRVKNQQMNDEKFNLIYRKFTSWMETDKNYTLKDINLEFVAKELGTNRDYLSKAIRYNNERFQDLINKYRIEEAINIITNKEDLRSKYSFIILASEVGYKSQSVFIDAFKKNTGLTPFQFRERYLSLNEEENSN